MSACVQLHGKRNRAGREEKRYEQTEARHRHQEASRPNRFGRHAAQWIERSPGAEISKSN
jgi:hypothetical protein